MKAKVNKTNVKIDAELLTSGMVGKILDIEYSSEWDDMTVVAVFSNGVTTKDVVNPGNACVIPHEVLAESAKHLSVGFYGYIMEDGEKVIAVPTVYGDLGRIFPGADPANDPSAPLTPTVAEQILALIGDLDKLTTEAKSDLVAAINEAAQGSGGGGSNKIWLPTVDANGNISWQKSETDTAPETRNIKGPAGAAGRDGQNGSDGKSAYQLAVDEGYTGTLAEWLASLKGETGAPGRAGQNGITPHIGANGNWYIGDTDTGLPSRGATGPAGQNGSNGQDGHTPERGTDYWTAEDIATIKGYVDDAILGGEW